jgi:hypothetical protein
MRLWVPVDKSKWKGSISAHEDYKPDTKTWRLATRGEKLRWEVTRPRFSLASGPGLWLLVALLFGILNALTGVRL